MKYNENYISQISSLQKGITDLRMEGIFFDDEKKEKRIIIEDTYKGILGTVLDSELNEEEKEYLLAIDSVKRNQFLCQKYQLHTTDLLD